MVAEIRYTVGYVHTVFSSPYTIRKKQAAWTKQILSFCITSLVWKRCGILIIYHAKFQMNALSKA